MSSPPSFVHVICTIYMPPIAFYTTKTNLHQSIWIANLVDWKSEMLSNIENVSSHLEVLLGRISFKPILREVYESWHHSPTIIHIIQCSLRGDSWWGNKFHVSTILLCSNIMSNIKLSYQVHMLLIIILKEFSAP